MKKICCNMIIIAMLLSLLPNSAIGATTYYEQRSNGENTYYIYDFSEFDKVDDFINGGTSAYSTSSQLGKNINIRSSEYGGPALQLQMWSTNEEYIEFKNSKNILSNYPYIRMAYDIASIDGDDAISSEKKLGSGKFSASSSSTSVAIYDVYSVKNEKKATVKKSSSDILNPGATIDYKRYVTSIVKLSASKDLRFCLTDLVSGSGLFGFGETEWEHTGGVNIKYIAFFKTEDEAESFDESIIGGSMSENAFTVDNFNHTITVNAPADMKKDELENLKISDLDFNFYNSAADDERAMMGGYYYSQECSASFGEGLLNVTNRGNSYVLQTPLYVKDLNGDTTEWTFTATSNQTAGITADNSLILGATIDGEYVSADTSKKTIAFTSGNIDNIEFYKKEGVIITPIEESAYQNGVLTKKYKATLSESEEIWTVTIGTQIDIDLSVVNGDLIAKFKNAPQGSQKISAMYSGNRLVDVITSEEDIVKIEDLSSGTYTAKAFLWNNMQGVRTVMRAEELAVNSLTYVSGHTYDIKNTKGIEWEPVPIASEKQLSNGHTGGSGGQVQTYTTIAKDGSVILSFADVGCINKSIDGGETWKEVGRNVKARGLSMGVIDPNNSDRVIGGTYQGVYGDSGYEKVTRQKYTGQGLYLSEDGAETFEQTMIINDVDNNLDSSGEPNEKLRKRDAFAWDPTSYDATLCDGKGGSSVAYYSTVATDLSASDLTKDISAYEISKGWNSGAGLYKSTDGGKTWQLINAGLGGAEVAVSPYDGTLFVASNKTLYKSTDKGASFTQIKTDVYDVETLVNSDSYKQYVFIVGQAGVSKSTDNGNTFTTATNTNFTATTNDSDIEGVFCFKVSPSNPNYMAYSKATEIYKNKHYYSHDGGNSWKEVRYNDEDDFSKVQPRPGYIAYDPNNENIVYNSSDWMWKSTDGGATYKWNSNGMMGECINSWWIPNVYNPDWWIVPIQDFAGALTLDGGKTFTSLYSIGRGKLKNHTYGAYVVNEKTYFLCGSSSWEPTSSTLYITFDGGESWQEKGTVTSGYLHNRCMQHPANPQILFAGNLRSTDGGHNWSAMSSEIKCVMDISKDGTKLFAQGTGDYKNNIYISEDDGANWSVYATATTSSSKEYNALQAVMEYDDTTDSLYVSSYGYVHKYQNGKLKSNFERAMRSVAPDFWCWSFAVDPNDANVLYAAGSGSDASHYNTMNYSQTILRSCDGGSSWQVISTIDDATSIIKTGPVVGRHMMKSMFVADDGYVYVSQANTGLYRLAPPY